MKLQYAIFIYLAFLDCMILVIYTIVHILIMPVVSVQYMSLIHPSSQLFVSLEPLVFILCTIRDFISLVQHYQTRITM